MTSTNAHSRNIFGITLLSSNHKDIRKLKRKHRTQFHGNKFWRASYLLMDYLKQQGPSPNERVLEVGCGWGLAGILCAKYCGSHVVATDIDAEVFPFLQRHAEINEVTIETRQRDFLELTTAELAEFDWLIAADICFWDELTEPVFELIERACSAGVGKIVIADPERPPFFELAAMCGDAFCAELKPYRIEHPKPATGALLIIENR